MKAGIATLTLCIGSLFASSALAEQSELKLSGYVAGETRSYPDDPLYSEQASSTSSLMLQPELYWEWNGGDSSLTFTPYVRVGDKDDERDHADIRELMWINVLGDWEIRAGIGFVFWGVAESQHLVDVINQTDAVENPDGEDKLGQPMLNITRISEIGTWDLFILPGFRERTFAGVKGRLRTGLVVDTDQDAIYESSDKDDHIDWAARWSHYIGDFDLALSHFSGTGRDPSFVPGINNQGQPVLVPRYDLMNQTGIAAQVIVEDWLWKLESTFTEQQESHFAQFTGGFEYTRVGIFETSMDLGIIAEYLYDDRGNTAPGPFEDDLMMGLRWVFNDAQSTEVLMGAIFDLDGTAVSSSIEATRRIGNSWKLSGEYRGISGVEATDPFYPFRQDTYLQLELKRFF